MSNKSKLILLVMAVMGILYLGMMAYPASMGARDPAMLSIFEIDEYAQYPHVIRMLTPGATFYQSLRNFFIYLHYFYGYPFYFLSGLILLPFKWIAGTGWENRTREIVTVLRLGVSGLPMIAALITVTALFTRFKSWWRSLGLYILLLALPGVVVNNFWWHPDSIAVLVVVLILFFLDRDNLRFGRYYYLAGFLCGVAVGIKYMGVFFVLAVPTYLVWGLATGKIFWRGVILRGAAFIVLMLAGLVLSNPILLLPIERGEIIATQKLQFEQTMIGVNFTNNSPLFSWGQYPEDFRVHYGEFVFVLIVLAGLAAGLVRKESRRLNSLILAWSIPIMYVVSTSATRRTHYFLPVLIPLLGCLLNLFPESTNFFANRKWFKSGSWIFNYLAMVLLLGQFVIFVSTDIEKFNRQAGREQESVSIQMYEILTRDYLSKLPADQKLVVYRDWHMYFPDKPGRTVEMSWELASYKYIKDLNPDLILLDRENILSFSEPSSVEKAVNRGQMMDRFEFYGDAKQDRLKGYRVILEDKAGSVLARLDVFEKFFQK